MCIRDSHLTFRQFYTHPEQPTKLSGAILCQQAHLCDMCAARRAARNLASAVPKVQKLLADNPHLRPYLLTITSANRSDLKAMKREQLAAWSTWLQIRRDSVKMTGRKRKACSLSAFEGGVMSWEVKRGKGSDLWHLHAHGVVLGPPGLNKHAFYPEWSAILGYDANLDLQPFKSSMSLDMGASVESIRDRLADDLLEVFKYALKTADLTYQDRWDASQVLHGVNLVRSFGICRGVKDLGEYLDDVTEFDGLPFLETVFRYMCGHYVETYSGHSDETGEASRPRVAVFDAWNAGGADTSVAPIAR